MDLTAHQTVGSYLLIEKLGAGGIGEVWKARDRRLNRVVALKFISRERQGSSPVRDLLREARAASALNHPNIVTVFEVVDTGDVPFLAMELVEGETLRERLKRPPLPLEETLDVAAQTLAGLAAAHRQGIVHRDLKPENIMLRVDRLVKLMDFGLAKAVPGTEVASAVLGTPSASTQSGAIVGTLTYMSPEQARGLPVSPASDVFSFGIVFYEMLAGEHPFHAETPMDTLTAILSREAPRLSARRPTIPQDYSDLCARALEKDSSKRHPSAVELEEELKAARRARQPRGRTALPAPPTAAQPKPRWMQALGAALIATLLAVAGWRWKSSGARTEQGQLVQSLAVMAFRAAGDDQRASTLAQDLPEELDRALSRTGWRVLSRASVQGLGPSPKPIDIGAQLGVDAVLEGSVRSFGEKLKVHVELVSTRNGFELWSETLSVGAEDLLGGEQTAAAQIAQEMRQALAPAK